MIHPYFWSENEFLFRRAGSNFLLQGFDHLLTSAFHFHSGPLFLSHRACEQVQQFTFQVRR